MTVCEYKPGLEGIPAAQSSISHVDGQKGILEYRGIRIEELAERSTFLETAYLLIWGRCSIFNQVTSKIQFFDPSYEY